jgi:DNA-binding Lrp family transcriptional regulator
MKVDEKDRKIINALLENSRLSYRQIAKDVALSVATVIKRVRALEKQGVIKEYSACIDYEKAGFDIDVIISIAVSKGNLVQMESKIANHPNVMALYDVTGEFDAVLLAKFKNRRALDMFLKHVQAFDFVQKTNTTLVLNTIKNEPLRV